MLEIFRKCQKCDKYFFAKWYNKHVCDELSVYRRCDKCDNHYKINWYNCHIMLCGVMV